jgi:hypothetical protein
MSLFRSSDPELSISAFLMSIVEPHRSPKVVSPAPLVQIFEEAQIFPNGFFILNLVFEG